MTDNRPNLDDAWLAACSRRTIWQSGDIRLDRLSLGAQEWDAVILPASGETPTPSIERDAAQTEDGVADWRDHPLAIIPDAGRLLAVFETASLVSAVLQGYPQPLETVLPLAVSMTRAVAAAHAQGVTLADLHPFHFAAGSDGRLRLRLGGPVDVPGGQTFSAAIQLHPSDDIVYRAPEQLRQLDPQTDTRSDLYALGMILFRLITGRFPLVAQTVLEWRHAHLALAPQNACRVDNRLPEMIGKILDRLLAKEPSVRYQSAIALEMDLVRCQQEWTQSRSIGSFDIGVIDAPFAQLSTPALSGREDEQHRLGDVARMVLQNRAPAVISVHGQPGVGKSALIQNLTQTLGARALFIQGKGDLQQSDAPYAPIVQAIHGLIDQAMRFDDTRLAAFRQAVSEGLDGNARFLLDLIPAMEIITGPQAPASDSPISLRQVLLQRGLRSVIAAAAATLSPIVLFIDDLQWADEATLSVLECLVREPTPGLLLVSAMRSDPASLPRPLASLTAAARAAGTVWTEIALAPLSLTAIRQMLLTIFPEASGDLLDLAVTLQEKTGGNPFYVRRLLQALVQDGVIAFSAAERAWSCRREDVARYQVSENILSFVTNRLIQFGAEALGILRMMACVGPETDKLVLARALEMTDEQLLDHAAPLVRSGFVAQSAAGLKFTHDRIQEAAYSLLDDAERRALHHRLAHVLLDTWGTQTGPAAFVIASQIEQCHAEDMPADERRTFILALLAALTHARRSAAAAQAARYGEAAVQLIDEAMWEADYALAFRAHLLLGEVLLSAAALDKAENVLEALLGRARSELDRSAVFRLRANLMTLQSDYEGSIEAVFSGLRELGVELKRWPSRQEQDAVYHELRALLGQRPVSTLEDLPAMADLRIRAAMSLLAQLISSVFTTDGLRFLHLAKMVELTLRHGACPESSHGLAWFGAMISEDYGAYRDGLEFCLAAKALVERYGYEEHRTSVLLAVDQVSPWTRPLPYALERVREAMAAAHAAGDVGWMCYARNHLVSDLIAIGEDIAIIAREAEESVSVCRRFGYSDIEHILTAQLSFVRLLADGNDRHRPDGEDAEPRAAIVAPTTAFWVDFYKGMSLYYAGSHARSIDVLMAADALAPLLLAHVDTAYCKFYLGMALAASDPGHAADSQARSRLMEIRQRFAMWAELNPENFRNKLLLLDGELARLSGNHALALRLFEQAATQAQQSRFQHEAGLALERAGQCCAEMGNTIGANAYRRLAAAAYHRWGARAKAETLIVGLAPDVVEPANARLAAMPNAEEAETVLGISRALSEDILLDRLIETLMKKMLVHAGANRGRLLKVEQGRFSVEASAWTEGADVRVSRHDGDEAVQGLPYSVIDKALQMRAPFVMSGSELAGSAPERDSTLAGRSLLCVPLLRRGELTGLLCLQNDYLEGVFAPDAIAIVTIIASQAAISLENARLYSSLLQENELRAQSERALAGARAELEKTSRLTLLGTIAASITHEIGQPLAAITSNAGAGLRWLQRAEPDIGETVTVLSEIQASVARAHDIIRALRALSKQAPSVRQDIRIDEIIREVLEISRSEIDRHGVDITTSLASAGQTVLGDATQLKQVILNLLQNGMEAMDDLPPDQRRMEITSRLADGQLMVAIRDFGGGIAPDIAAQIFEPMYTTKSSGMGMGLAICKSIIEAHEGTLRSTAMDVGTLFSFALPITTEGV